MCRPLVIYSTAVTCAVRGYRRITSHEKARVVTVSSGSNYVTTGLDFDAIADGPGRTKYNGWELYNKSKFVRLDPK